jgi:hypothetical protein
MRHGHRMTDQISLTYGYIFQTSPQRINRYNILLTACHRPRYLTQLIFQYFFIIIIFQFLQHFRFIDLLEKIQGLIKFLTII